MKEKNKATHQEGLRDEAGAVLLHGVEDLRGVVPSPVRAARFEGEHKGVDEGLWELPAHCDKQVDDDVGHVLVGRVDARQELLEDHQPVLQADLAQALTDDVTDFGQMTELEEEVDQPETVLQKSKMEAV